jgi:predicted HTH transcriptional regulator
MRHTESSNVVIKPSDIVINNVVKRADVIIKFTPIEEKATNIFLRNPKISASQLGDQLGVVLRQAQRVMDSLKKKAGLKRRGARKNGEWYFEK